MRATSDVLRLIAGVELDRLFPDLAPRLRDDFATSVVRQWLTCAGRAGICTELLNYWLHFEELANEQFSVHTETTPAHVLRDLLRHHRALEDDIPRILLRLSLSQLAVFDNEKMLLFEVRVSPHLRRFAVQSLDEDEE